MVSEWKGKLDAKWLQRTPKDLTGPIVCESKDRTFSEEHMLDKFRKTAHAQIQVYMVMLEDDNMRG